MKSPGIKVIAIHPVETMCNPFNNLKGQPAGGIKAKVMGSPMAVS